MSTSPRLFVPSKAADFDPYRKWLAIAPSEQPFSYDRLLGIGLFKSDTEAITQAADGG